MTTHPTPRTILSYHAFFREALTLPVEDRAYNLAQIAHYGQTRKDGETPYLRHPWRVGQIVMEHLSGKMDSRPYVAAAFLHDVLEDSDITRHDLVPFFPGAEGVDILDAVELLTHKDSDSYADYLFRIVQDRTKAGDIARAVKIADAMANLEDVDKVPDKGAQKGLRTKLGLVLLVLTKMRPAFQHD